MRTPVAVGSLIAVGILVAGCSTAAETDSVAAKPAELLIQTDAVIAGPANNVRDVEVISGKTMLIASHDERGQSASDGIWSLEKGGDPQSARQITKVARPGAIESRDGKTIFVSLPYSSTIKTLDPKTGVLSDFAGSGKRGFAGDGGAAVSASFNYPWGLAATSTTLYVGDTNNNRIRAIDLKTRIVTTVVGTGTAGFSGDGGSPLKAQLRAPGGLDVDKTGDLYFADVLNQRIRFVDFDKKAAAVITTVAGNGKVGFSGDGGAATDASLNYPWGVAVPASKDAEFIISDTRNNRIRAVAGQNTISTIAGNGKAGYSGDGGPAVDATLSGPFGISYEKDTTNGGGSGIFIAEAGNHAVRELDTKLSQVANPANGLSARTVEDGGPPIGWPPVN